MAFFPNPLFFDWAQSGPQRWGNRRWRGAGPRCGFQGRGCGFQSRGSGCPPEPSFDCSEALNELERLVTFLREMSGANNPSRPTEEGAAAEGATGGAEGATGGATGGAEEGPADPQDTLEHLMAFVRDQPELFNGIDNFMTFLRRNMPQKDAEEPERPQEERRHEERRGGGPRCFWMQRRGRADQFRVHVDASGFKPEEIEVKVADGHIVVSASHEERSDGRDGSMVSRQMTRKFTIPEGVVAESLTSRLTPGGRLIITAPLKGKDDETEIPVEIETKNAVEHENKNAAEQQETPKKE